MRSKFVILLILLSSYFTGVKIEIMKNNYVETIPENAKYYIERIEDSSILLSSAEIKKYNEEIKEKTDKIYDLNRESFTKEEIENYILSYELPKGRKFDKNREINELEKETILANRNKEEIHAIEKVTYGLTVNRTNLKSFPTDTHFFDHISDTNFDNLQETEVHLNEPLFILHESKDKEWFFVMTKTYVGWVKQEDVVVAEKAAIDFFTKNYLFGVVTDSLVKINQISLDMSVKLPCIGVNQEGYQCLIPVKGSDEKLLKKEVTIAKDKLHIGYLPYTKRNVYIQAFKYEGTPYRWSGMDEGVDCSSFVSNVYRTFGFEFPRNTIDQNTSVGEVISLENKTLEEKKQILMNQEPNLLYQNGHVLIYLGTKNEKPYVIDAAGDERVLKVAEEELTSSNYLSKIHRLVLIR